MIEHQEPEHVAHAAATADNAPGASASTDAARDAGPAPTMAAEAQPDSPRRNSQPPAGPKAGAGHGLGYGGSLLAGLAGGALVCFAAAGLQKTGVLPSFAPNGQEVASVSQESLPAELAQLKQQLAAVTETQARMADSMHTEQQGAAAAGAGQDAAAAAAIVADARSKAQSALDAVSLMRQQLAENPDPAAIGELQQRVTQRINELETRLKALDSLQQDMAATQTMTRNQASKLDNLQKDLAALSEKGRETGAGMTLLIAANALKAAVDRGGSYASELLTFEAVAPQGLQLDLLKRYADKGLPSASELSARFTHVADRIARTENTTAVGAGIGSQVLAWARALVSARPVGYVEGASPGAIAARMEVAIAAGDYRRAMNEWQALPDQAKAVSADFMTTLQARSDVDSLLSRFVARALSPQLRHD